MADMAVCEHTTIPQCREHGCTRPQRLRGDGRPMGFCDEHWHQRLPHVVAVGTISPGPRGVGWRVKTLTGWKPCTATGEPFPPRKRVTLAEDVIAQMRQARDVIDAFLTAAGNNP